MNEQRKAWVFHARASVCRGIALSADLDVGNCVYGFSVHR